MIGKKIRQIRIQKELSQEAIAHKLSMSQSAYAKVEKGITKLDMERFIKIAEILETDPYDLLQIDNGKTINFNNSQLTNGYVENFYAEQKELFEKQIKHLEDEIIFLRSQLK